MKTALVTSGGRKSCLTFVRVQPSNPSKQQTTYEDLRTINRRGIELTAFWLRAFAQQTGNFPQRAAHSTPTLQDSAEIRSSARAQALRTNL